MQNKNTYQIVDDNKHVFGITSFREGQREAIVDALSGLDVFVLMPTGGGKSLVYQLPGICEDGITIVISPLVSLIQDQVRLLVEKGIRVISFTSTLSPLELQQAFDDFVGDAGVRFAYVTPERILTNRFVDMMKANVHRIRRFVVDESHCVSKWGADYRPDYAQLSALRIVFPSVPLMALTATATEKTVDDIKKTLGFSSDRTRTYRTSFNRSNIMYCVSPKGKAVARDIFDRIQDQNMLNKSGIIYCLSRKDCEELAVSLNTQFHTYKKTEHQDYMALFGARDVTFAAFYHAGGENKQAVQDSWIRGDTMVICATIAFGMGINKPDVRYVYHHTFPQSMEGYYQEAGRAGRDGQRSDSVVWYAVEDRSRINFILRNNSDTNEERKKRGLEEVADDVVQANIKAANEMASFCENTTLCRREMQLKHFGETFDPVDCHHTCDNCKRRSPMITDFFKRKK